MSSEKVPGGFAFVCDDCGDRWTPSKLGLGSATRDFRESFESAKEDGWRAYKKSETWHHACPEC